MRKVHTQKAVTSGSDRATVQSLWLIGTENEKGGLASSYKKDFKNRREDKRR